MRKNIKNSLIVATSLLMLNACGGEDEAKKDEPVVVIDESHLQTVEEINTTTHVCSLGDDIVTDGNASEFDTTTDRTTLEWRMTLDTGKDKDLRVDECNLTTDVSRLCFQVNPEKAGTGMYQEITTEIGTRYRVSAELIGADNVNDKNNFDQGSSYVSIEDSKPQETSIPLAYSKEIKGNTPTKVEFDFNATKETMYVQLRGTEPFKYPTAFYISVKKLIVKEGTVTENDSSVVPCNL